MEDIFLSATVDHRRTICLSPLSYRSYRDAGGKGLGGDYGYFIYEIDEDHPAAGIEVIAKAKSADAALRLYEMISRQYA
jgi:hypothetical protein